MPTKIFILTCSYLDENKNGGSIFVHNQAIALKKRGFEVYVLFYDFRSIRKKRRFLLTNYCIDGIKVFRCAMPCGPIPFLLSLYILFFKNKLYRYAVKNVGTPNFIHAHFFDAGFIAYKLSLKYNLKYYVTEHSSGVLQNELTRREKKYARDAYENAVCVFPVSESLKKIIENLYNCRLKIVPNVIPDYFYNKTTVIDNKKTTYVFISVGNLIERKRFDLTINAFSNLVNQGKNVILNIVGDGPLNEELRQMVIDLKIDKKVHFFGNIANSKLREIYEQSDCFVLPSDFETFGVVYCEAMACGLPVIATKCGGPEDFVDSNNGVLIQKGNLEELTNAMNSFYNNIVIYDKTTIIENSKKHFSEDAIVDLLNEEYMKVSG